MSDFKSYMSPFSWRYGSVEMRGIWSEINKRKLWRYLWVSLAKVQSEFGLFSGNLVDELKTFAGEIEVTTALEIEAEIKHDLMAEIRVFADQCPNAGRIIHLGATSVDIKDNAAVLQIRESLDLLISGIKNLLLAMVSCVEETADWPIIGFTHLQPAEPITLGYRFALYAQDILFDYDSLISARKSLRGKGFKGAVGSSASYIELIGIDKIEAFEKRLSEIIDLPFYPITNQTYPRKQDYSLLSAIAGLGASLYKFAFDLRILQSPGIGEQAEPFGKVQVGSSAMPFKRNPLKSEKIDSLARMIAQFPRIAWDNCANSLLERTLDDSANRRSILPESFLVADEIVRVATEILLGIQLDKSAMQSNLKRYGPFAATERVLMALGKTGADRQESHERLRGHAMKAWKQTKIGNENPLKALMIDDPFINSRLSREQLEELMNIDNYTGNSAQQAKAFAIKIKNSVE